MLDVPVASSGQEEEVRRVMGYYKTALERYCDAEDVEAMWVPGFNNISQQRTRVDVVSCSFCFVLL